MVDIGGGNGGVVEGLALGVAVGSGAGRHLGVCVWAGGFVGGSLAADGGVAEGVEAEFGEKAVSMAEVDVVELECREVVAEVAEGAGRAAGAGGATGIEAHGAGYLAAGRVPDVEGLVAVGVGGDGDGVVEDGGDFSGAAPEVHVERYDGEGGEESEV